MFLIVAMLLLACGPRFAAAASPEDDPESIPEWQQVRVALFGTRPIAAAEPETLVMEAPNRAEDAAIVPLVIRSRVVQSPTRHIKTVWLVIDGNPSPAGVTFHFAPESGRVDLETRVRIEQYGFVRAIAELNDGSLHMVTRFVKASGGCSAPAGKDPAAAAANLGRMKLRIDEGPPGGEPRRAQLMISHPNTSGLAMDQLTRLYPKASFVRQVTVSYRDKPVFVADVDFSISENPSFRFLFRADDEGELKADVVDTDGRKFRTAVTLGSGASAGAHFERVAPGAFVLAGPSLAAEVPPAGNVGLLVGRDAALLIDTGASDRQGREILAAARRVTDRPVRLALISHGLPEFLFGATALQEAGIPVLAQHHTAELIAARCARCLARFTSRYGDEAMGGTRVPVPDRLVEGDMSVELGEHTVEIVDFGPASTPGDLAVLDRANGILFAGGLVVVDRVPLVRDADLGAWIAALDRIATLPVRRIVPGHGPVVAVDGAATLRTYLAELDAGVRRVYANRVSLAEAGDGAPLPAYAAWAGYPDVHGENVRHLYLALERAELDAAPPATPVRAERF
jgi:sulfur-oxidizing protein SoxY